jgi:polysaccharide deacetylase family protein (PEP-CTERM system associated)
MKHFVFSIDVEDWFQVENLKGVILSEDWTDAELRISKSTEVILDLLEKHGVRATFFILGWIAERKPGLVKRISDKGHEIASHGYQHELLHKIDANSMETDIMKSLEILSPLSHNNIIGYRAPSFSITKDAAHLLKAMGFLYDASLNDFQFNRRYGRIKVYKKTGRIKRENCAYMVLENDLVEFPISVNTYFNVYWPLGGGYFRLSPMWFLKKQLHDVFKVNDVVSIYLHPWEFDPDQPRVRGLSLDYHFRHYYGLDDTAKKFDCLIRLIQNMHGVEIGTFGEIASDLKAAEN